MLIMVELPLIGKILEGILLELVKLLLLLLLLLPLEVLILLIVVVFNVHENYVFGTILNLNFILVKVSKNIINYRSQQN